MYHKLFKNKTVQQVLKISQKIMLPDLHLEWKIIRAEKIVEIVKIKILIKKAKIWMENRYSLYINLAQFR